MLYKYLNFLYMIKSAKNSSFNIKENKNVLIKHCESNFYNNYNSIYESFNTNNIFNDSKENITATDIHLNQNHGKLNGLRSWKEYLWMDNFTFCENVEEMYNSYNCGLKIDIFEKINDIDDLYLFEEINFKLHIYDLSEIFLNNKEDSTSENSNAIDLMLSDVRLKNLFVDFNSNFKQFVGSKAFLMIFDIIENDLKNIFKNAIEYFYQKNEFLKYEYLKLFEVEHIDKIEDKFWTILDIIKNILNLDLNTDLFINQNKIQFIYTLLLSCNSPNKQTKTIRTKVIAKLRLMYQFISNDVITLNEVLKYTIFLLNTTEDRKIQMMLNSGLQNLFFCDSYRLLPRFLHLVIYLFAAHYEQKKYTINWQEQIFRILGYSNYQLKVPKYCYNTIKNIFSDFNKKKYIQLYLIINSHCHQKKLYLYADVFENEKKLDFIYDLIKTVNILKFKFFGLKIDNLRYHYF